VRLCDRSCDGRPCSDPETDEPCAQCSAAMDEALREAWAEYAAASPAERDPVGYARDMVDGGRGHLLTEEDRSWL